MKSDEQERRYANLDRLKSKCAVEGCGSTDRMSLQYRSGGGGLPKSHIISKWRVETQNKLIHGVCITHADWVDESAPKTGVVVKSPGAKTSIAPTTRHELETYLGPYEKWLFKCVSWILEQSRVRTDIPDLELSDVLGAIESVIIDAQTEPAPTPVEAKPEPKKLTPAELQAAIDLMLGKK